MNQKKSVETTSEVFFRYNAQQRGVADPQGEIFRFSIVGQRHHGCLPSTPVRKMLVLELEPDNPYDPNAIKVLDGDVHIGYIDASETAPIHQVWDRIGSEFWLVNGTECSAVYLVRLTS